MCSGGWGRSPGLPYGADWVELLLSIAKEVVALQHGAITPNPRYRAALMFAIGVVAFQRTGLRPQPSVTDQARDNPRPLFGVHHLWVRFSPGGEGCARENLARQQCLS